MTPGMFITAMICGTVLALGWMFVYMATHMPPK